MEFASDIDKAMFMAGTKVKGGKNGGVPYQTGAGILAEHWLRGQGFSPTEILDGHKAVKAKLAELAKAENGKPGEQQGPLKLDEVNAAKVDGELNHAMQAGLDINQRVDVVDITSSLGQLHGYKDVLQFLRTLAKQPYDTADASKVVEIGRNREKLEHAAYSVVRPSGRDKDTVTAAMHSIVDLLRAAPFVEEGPNQKPGKKPNIDSYYRFYVPVWDGAETHMVRIVAEMSKRGLVIDPNKVDLYEVIKENSGLPSSKGGSASGATPVALAGKPASITIRQMLAGVKDMDGKPYIRPGDTGSVDTTSPEFRQWFGDSKVVDAEGQPLRVYKGMQLSNWKTGESITEINSANGPWAGMFTSRPDVASKFSDAFRGHHGANDFDSAVVPAHIRMEHPFEVDAGGRPARDFQFDNIKPEDRNQEILAALSDDQYDGIIIRNTSDVQLEVGASASTFEVLPRDVVKQRCAWFYRTYATSQNTSDLAYQMRATPTSAGTGPYTYSAEL